MKDGTDIRLHQIQCRPRSYSIWDDPIITNTDNRLRASPIERHSQPNISLTEAQMLRREFLKLSGLLSAALLVQVNPSGTRIPSPVEVESQGKLYRGTPDGKIYISENAGRNWQLHTNFGSQYDISSLSSSRPGQVYARLAFAGHFFEIVLGQNNKIWRTV